jgi:hypothetical protein
MVNRPHKFQDRDIKRVIKATRDAGFNTQIVEVDTRRGVVRAIAGNEAADDNPFEREAEKLRKEGRHAKATAAAAPETMAR